MSNWLHRLLNPHCKDCKQEREDERYCKSCETLQTQLAVCNREREHLLDLLHKDPVVAPEVKPPEMTRPKVMPWGVRKQILESEDRAKARAMRGAAKPDVTTDKPGEPIDVSDLEKELDIASANRENGATTGGS